MPLMLSELELGPPSPVAVSVTLRVAPLVRLKFVMPVASALPNISVPLAKNSAITGPLLSPSTMTS